MDFLIDSSSITMTVQERSIRMLFSEINDFSETTQLFYLSSKRHDFLTIPKAHLSDEEISALRLTFKSANKKPSYPAIVQSSIQTKKPSLPYSLGLLCLIPGIGGIFGLLLLLSGVFQYKDKWLVVIGVSGISFSVLVIFFISNLQNQNVLNTEYFQTDLKKTSQRELNNLVDKIESYKSKNGDYPELLEDLRYYAGERAPIIDPVHLGKKGRYPYYHYKRVGDKYVLFSSGFDGMPNTNDDLHPQISKGEKTSTGSGY